MFLNINNIGTNENLTESTIDGDEIVHNLNGYGDFSPDSIEEKKE
jgi:hypothetical protein